jgi:hypothetical protein
MATGSGVDWYDLYKTSAPIIAAFVGSTLAFGYVMLGISIEKRKQLNQELVKRRMKFYDDVAVNLNKVFCFYRAVGDWHSLTPTHIIAIKREIDRDFNMFRYILSQSTYSSYRHFIATFFKEFNGPGVVAKLIVDREHLERHMGNKYDFRWESEFADYGVEYKKHEEAYTELMTCLGNDVMGIRAGGFWSSLRRHLRSIFAWRLCHVRPMPAMPDAESGLIYYRPRPSNRTISEADRPLVES